jgi:hypothetical protein
VLAHFRFHQFNAIGHKADGGQEQRPVLRWEYNIRVPIETILPAYTSTFVSTSNLPTELADPCDTVRPEMLSRI